jgi:hypothetical protein
MSENKLRGEVYYPSKETLEKSQLKDRKDWDARAKKDYLGFWADFAEELHWFQKVG